jgi:hypothetical protein
MSGALSKVVRGKLIHISVASTDELALLGMSVFSAAVRTSLARDGMHYSRSTDTAPVTVIPLRCISTRMRVSAR